MDIKLLDTRLRNIWLTSTKSNKDWNDWVTDSSDGYEMRNMLLSFAKSNENWGDWIFDLRSGKGGGK
jgi:hypothetical protein